MNTQLVRETDQDMGVGGARAPGALAVASVAFYAHKGSQVVSMNSRGVHACSVVSCTKHRQLSGGLKLGCSWRDVKGLREENVKLLLQQQLCFSGYQVCRSV